ncbi:hypothetical protein F0562_013446 [Nyssa sinensis]|uniref:Uncharacterized protein n=1 Tax=Nyssa sinensis TaxID=561372 RepID=A0A5J4ZKH8_9ASTE|nr:hypothetical protein F0562_013446 [Nyssa sinensis]
MGANSTVASVFNRARLASVANDPASSIQGQTTDDCRINPLGVLTDSDFDGLNSTLFWSVVMIRWSWVDSMETWGYDYGASQNGICVAVLCVAVWV